MQIEIGLPPLRDIICLKAVKMYKRNSLGVKNSLNHLIFKDEKYQEEMKKRLEELGIPQQREIHVERYQTQPWIDKTEFIRAELQMQDKKQLGSRDVNKVFEEEINSLYSNQIHIYTDGSKVQHPISTSCAVYNSHRGHLKTWKLPPEFSVFSAELLAIYKAVEGIDQQYNNSKVTIFSDSKSALEAILTDKQKSHYLTNIINSIINHARLSKSTEISLQWVPGHCGIKGNEIADKGANLAHNLTYTEETQLSYAEFCDIAIKKMTTKLTQQLSQKIADTKYGKITVSPTIDTKAKSKMRSLDVAYTRLRLGHSKLAAEQFKKGLVDDPNCSACKVPQTIDHYLLVCIRYIAPRIKLMRNLHQLGVSFSKEELLTVDPNNTARTKVRELVIQFLMETKEFNII